MVGAYAVLIIEGLRVGSASSWRWTRGAAGLLVRQALPRPARILAAEDVMAEVAAALHPFGLAHATRAPQQV